MTIPKTDSSEIYSDNPFNNKMILIMYLYFLFQAKKSQFTRMNCEKNKNPRGHNKDALDWSRIKLIVNSLSMKNLTFHSQATLFVWKPWSIFSYKSSSSILQTVKLSISGIYEIISLLWKPWTSSRFSETFFYLPWPRIICCVIAQRQ